MGQSASNNCEKGCKPLYSKTTCCNVKGESDKPGAKALQVLEKPPNPQLFHDFEDATSLHSMGTLGRQLARSATQGALLQDDPKRRVSIGEVNVEEGKKSSKPGIFPALLKRSQTTDCLPQQKAAQPGPQDYFEREREETAKLKPAEAADNASPDALAARPRHNFESGASYVGQWRGNVRHGAGAQCWPDGARYEGQWKDDHAAGAGVFCYASGDVYVGQWDQSMAKGLGTYHHKATQASYEGGWDKDLQHGLGIERWVNGSVYAGEFAQGLKEGYGVCRLNDGSMYSGEWRANLLCGTGILRGKDGKHLREIRGGWRGSAVHGVGQVQWSDGSTFWGQFEQDRMNGFGVLQHANGKRYEGVFENGDMVKAHA